MKRLLTAAALAVLAASPAFAATHTHKRTAHPTATPSQGYGAYASMLNRDNVVVDGNVVGRDPDSGIRLQLRRDADSPDY